MAEDPQQRVIEHARDDLSGVGAQVIGRFSQPETTAEDKRSWLGKVMDYLMDRVLPEVGGMVMQKTAQGSAEIAHALNSQSNAFTPYGPAQNPLNPLEAQNPLEVEGPQFQYQQSLREAQNRSTPEQGGEMER